MFNTKEGYSLSDIAAVTGSNNGFDGNGFGGWWIILLFLFAFGGWGNGFGGWGSGNNGTAVTADIGYNFDMHDISSGVRDLASSTANGFYNINTGLLNGFSGTQAQICNTGFDTIQAINANSLSALQSANALQAQLAAHSADEQLCCCQTQNRIDSNFATLNYNLATEACADRAAVTTGVRDVIDNANNNTRQILDFLVQDRITALTINALRPAAEPAYLVANPYTGNYGTFGYNANYGGPICNGFMG